MKRNSFLMAILLFCSLAFAGSLSSEYVLNAAESGNLVQLKKYQQQKGDLNVQDAQGLTPLMKAVANGQKGSVLFLLKNKVNLELKNENGDTALLMAIGNEQDEIAVLLIEAGAKLDVLGGEDKNNLVFLATSVNAEKTLKTLLKKSPEQLQAKNQKGETPLHEAARFGSEKTLRTLLKAGAKKEVTNNDGKTPLDIAKSIKNEAAVKLLESSSLVK